MASSLVVPVVTLTNLREHPNAALLGLADVLGYQMVVPLEEDAEGPIEREFVHSARDANGKRVPYVEGNDDITELVRFNYKYREGQPVVYFPADTLLPDEWIERFGVRGLLKGKEQNRVGKIRLRGEPSFGLVVEMPEGATWDVGQNVAEYYGAQKYIPPVRATAGDAAKYDEEIDPFVERYTDIENGRIFVDVFKDGEEIIVTEKLHGTNCKAGIVNGRQFAGSMEVRRKPPEKTEEMSDEEYNNLLKANIYWHPWSLRGVQALMDHLTSLNAKQIILYGEVFGPVQSLKYGRNSIDFRAFDLLIGGRYVDWDVFKKLCEEYGVLTVPVLYRGPWSMAKMKELADGNTTMDGASHIREGIVVKPVRERTDTKIGRAVLKYIGTEYELSKHKEKDNTDT